MRAIQVTEMRRLNQIKDQHQRLELTAEAALELIFDLYLVSESTLAEHGFTLKEFGYGIYQLKKKSENYTFEGDYNECCERFSEILDKCLLYEEKLVKSRNYLNIGDKVKMKSGEVLTIKFLEIDSFISEEKIGYIPKKDIQRYT